MAGQADIRRPIHTAHNQLQHSRSQAQPTSAAATAADGDTVDFDGQSPAGGVQTESGSLGCRHSFTAWLLC